MLNCFSKESFSLGYKKVDLPKKEDLEKINTEITEIAQSIKYNPFNIRDIQNYNPTYKEIFQLSNKNYNSISLNHPKHVYFKDIKNTESTVSIKDCFIKYSPLLDPYRYLTGKYIIDETITRLPKMDNEDIHPKLLSVNNASYIDNFFCYLSSQLYNFHHFPNSIDYYGSFLGIQEKFRVNIADDIDHLRSSDFFINNKSKIYEIDDYEESGFMNFSSRKNKERLFFHNISNISQISIEDLNITEKMKGFIITLGEKSKEISKHIGTSVKDELLKENRSAFVSASNKIKEAKEASKIVFDTSLLNLYKSEEEKYLAYYKESIENVINAYSKKEAMSSLDVDFNTFESDAHDLLNSIYGLSSPHDEL